MTAVRRELETNAKVRLIIYIYTSLIVKNMLNPKQKALRILILTNYDNEVKKFLQKIRVVENVHVWGNGMIS